VYNNPYYNILVDLRLRLSPPCGNQKSNYNRRHSQISELYKVAEDCDYIDNNG